MADRFQRTPTGAETTQAVGDSPFVLDRGGCPYRPERRCPPPEAAPLAAPDGPARMAGRLIDATGRHLRSGAARRGISGSDVPPLSGSEGFACQRASTLPESAMTTARSSLPSVRRSWS
jgi:hypothetical protein